MVTTLMKKLGETIKLWHLVAVVLLSMASFVFGTGMQWQRISSELEKIERVENRVDNMESSIHRLDRNMVAIGAALKVDGLEKPPR